jgi:hypothetical protein
VVFSLEHKLKKDKNIMTNKEKFKAILDTIEKLEIHGQSNIFIMANLMGFLTKEIQQESEKEKSIPPSGEGG